jgi:hypothetical protein
MNSNANTESEKFFPEHMQGDDDQPMVINNEDLFSQGWTVSTTGFTGSGGSAGSKGMFVETSDSDAENGSGTTGDKNTFTHSGNNEDLFSQG